MRPDYASRNPTLSLRGCSEQVFLATRDERGLHALCYAAAHGHLAAAKVMVDEKANLEEADSQGRTALHWAAHANQAKMCKLLIGAGANIAAVRWTPPLPLLEGCVAYFGI